MGSGEGGTQGSCGLWPFCPHSGPVLMGCPGSCISTPPDSLSNEQQDGVKQGSLSNMNNKTVTINFGVITRLLVWKSQRPLQERTEMTMTPSCSPLPQTVGPTQGRYTQQALSFWSLKSLQTPKSFTDISQRVGSYLSTVVQGTKLSLVVLPGIFWKPLACRCGRGPCLAKSQPLWKQA